MKNNHNKSLSYKCGVVKTHKHPVFKFGQSVIIIEETEDLYRVKLHANSQAEIISKEDLLINK